ncbi:MAG: DUF3107 domain-containing protein [Mycobacteriales bacterium]
MEVKIGVENSPRELTIESDQTPDEVEQAVREALTGSSKSGDVLALVDEKGRRVLVPTAKVAYVEIAEAESRRVGFVTG